VTVRLSARGGGPSPWVDPGGLPPPAPAPAPPSPPPAPPPARGGFDVIGVPAYEARAVWSRPLAPGVLYVVEASGAFSVWGDRSEGVDAYYVYDRERSGGWPQLWSQLLIDDRPMVDVARGNGDTHAFKPGHVYLTTVRGDGRPLKLQIADARNGSWHDNRGQVTVRIYPR
jgi:hypothetical protein